MCNSNFDFEANVLLQIVQGYTGSEFSALESPENPSLWVKKIKFVFDKDITHNGREKITKDKK